MIQNSVYMGPEGSNKNEAYPHPVYWWLTTGVTPRVQSSSEQS